MVRETWRSSFRSHKLKISTFLENAHKMNFLFLFCDQKQQIFNIIKCRDKCMRIRRKGRKRLRKPPVSLH
ncbi:hypothetical protein EAJ18_20575 [Citrobacter amalonaticus]|uniref:Uncharacterized protein n=1 Tax=Citrobacter amalonaticus TaxID=35703 RepID=A0ABY0HRW2_CITAM|nr:hypothetical protein EAJ18_20575 [Citrobacter amalonaticus]